jgi:hypothetical protein
MLGLRTNRYVRCLGGLGVAAILVACGSASSDPAASETAQSLVTGPIPLPPGCWPRRAPVLGDVNGDCMADLMLVGGTGWNTLPVALSGGGGAFAWHNGYVGADVDTYLSRNGGGRALLGDFNRDHLADVALLSMGNDDWGTIKIEFSDGGQGESFHSTQKRIDNYAEVPFTEFATQGLQAATGDFNGDGATDIALLGGPGWGTIPVATSNFDGSFHATNEASNLQSLTSGRWQYTLAAGDFNGDTLDDLVLVPSCYATWTTIPIARSVTNGRFDVTNSWNPELAAAAESACTTRPLVGDYNHDGCADIALVNGQFGASGVKLAFGDCAYHFHVVTPVFTYDAAPGGDFPLWATQTGATPIALDFNGDGRTDLALTQGQGWGTVPVARSSFDVDGNGSFQVTNTPVTLCPAVAAQSGAQLVRQ